MRRSVHRFAVAPASAFHAFGLGGVSVCAMGAIVEKVSAEEIVADILDCIMDGGDARPPQQRIAANGASPRG